jgi:hypothetical protein
MDSALQDHLSVLPREVRREPGDSTQVKAAVGQHLQQHRVLA